MRTPVTLALFACLAACRASAPSPPLDAREPDAPTPAQGAAGSAGASPEGETPAYPWLGAEGVPAREGDLKARFAAPDGFKRVALSDGSFGHFLRHLPLAPATAPVLTHDGKVLRPPGHGNVAAVVAIDIGTADLQQCADSIIRMHAEWLWSKGRRDISYRSASGLSLPWSRWAAGERVVIEGKGIAWARGGKADGSHGAFRRYLDAVFGWANTGSLARDTQRIGQADIAPGDFFVQPGSPGHAVLVLDMVIDAEGRRRVLLGQGFMPAQSFHVLKPSGGSPWYVVDPASSGIETPFWAPFTWGDLRRFAQ